MRGVRDRVRWGVTDRVGVRGRVRGGLRGRVRWGVTDRVGVRGRVRGVRDRVRWG